MLAMAGGEGSRGSSSLVLEKFGSLLSQSVLCLGCHFILHFRSRADPDDEESFQGDE